MKLISDDEIMGAVVEVDTPLGCNISIGAFPALKAVAQAQLDADLKDQQAERERIVGEIEKLLNKIIWFSDNTPCISEEKERGCFRCTAEEIELWWQSLKNKILGGEL